MKTTAGTGERIMQILDGTINAVRRTLQLAPHQQPQNARILGIVIGALEEIGRTCLSQAHQAKISELVNLVMKQDVSEDSADWVEVHRLQLEDELPEVNRQDNDEEDEVQRAIDDELSKMLGFDVRDKEQLRKFWMGMIDQQRGR